MEIRPLASSPQPTATSIERQLSGGTATASPAVTPAAAPSAGRADERSGGAGLHQAVEHINKSLQASAQSVEFSVDEDSERVIVKVVDRDTGEVLRQMPSQEALDIAKALDRTQGLLIKNQA
ncbi:flagellar protein FlaG [Massilia norwichensis]|uniref:Flagellar protein FlaG n=1 Tax=Massilia norwichensis TaxID=1442366 RepID=A0ABT2A5R5_9BURK|nr:flagellar protein FlaG [Massilia norwichensis]MCS0589479.1 flagellar protein FlaG [Massilia norwichensis]